MAAAVGKYAANKMLKKEMDKYQSKKVAGGDDPYFAYVDDPDNPGKQKKMRKQIPEYISDHDKEILAAVRRRAYRMDMCLFNLFGTRFGWEAVIGLIPGFGDLIGVFFALMIFRKCRQVEGGLDKGVQIKMLVNIIVDFVIGLVPFLGDIADAFFKANTLNCRLLEEFLDKKHKPKDFLGDDRPYGGDSEKRRQNRKSGIYHQNDPPPATILVEKFDQAPFAHHEPDLRRPAPSKSKYGSRRDDRHEVRGAPMQETGSIRR